MGKIVQISRIDNNCEVRKLENKITLDNKIIDLKSILCDDAETAIDYWHIVNSVKAILFSKYEIRQKAAWEYLHRTFNTLTQVCTLTDSGIMYAYLSITKELDAFLFIGKYDAAKPKLEEALHPLELNT